MRLDRSTEFIFPSLRLGGARMVPYQLCPVLTFLFFVESVFFGVVTLTPLTSLSNFCSPCLTSK